jgi:putative hydrolase
VNDVPFGFGKSAGSGNGDEPPSGGGPTGPGGAGGLGDFGNFGFGTGEPGGISDALHRFADLLSWQGGPVNWDLAKDVARQAAAGDDPSVGTAERAAVDDAMRLAELWLDASTGFPSATSRARAWSRAEWIEATLPIWAKLVEPVATKVVESFGGGVSGGPGGAGGLGALGALGGLLGLPGGDTADGGDGSAELPAEFQQMAGPFLSMLRQMGGVMFGSQVGQALGTLAREVTSSTDVGLPLAGIGRAALVPAGIAAFGEGLGIPIEEVRLFVALREAAHHRLFAAVPWLQGRLFAAIEDYAQGITVDTSAMQEALGTIDPTNPEALQAALAGGLFEPQATPGQQATLGRLETLLALVEGWVDAVVADAARDRLTAADALRETFRRRRATGGPAEQTFSTLVGLELRPRRMREAAQLWQLLRHERGADGRDALWEHPDLLPTTRDLDDPQAFVDHRDAEFDMGSFEADLSHDGPDPGTGERPDTDEGPATPQA